LPFAWRCSLFAFLLAGCPTAPTIDQTQEDCQATHARVGQAAELTTRFHDVSGTARIVDDCTIVIENFTYDGDGVDVRVYVADNAAFENGVVLTNDLRRDGGYDNETLTVKLPVGVTLDDTEYISIWCYSVSMSFGDGRFQ
jgi:hypothetical protein